MTWGVSRLIDVSNVSYSYSIMLCFRMIFLADSNRNRREFPKGRENHEIKAARAVKIIFVVKALKLLSVNAMQIYWLPTSDSVTSLTHYGLFLSSFFFLHIILPMFTHKFFFSSLLFCCRMCALIVFKQKKNFWFIRLIWNFDFFFIIESALKWRRFNDSYFFCSLSDFIVIRFRQILHRTMIDCTTTNSFSVVGVENRVKCSFSKVLCHYCHVFLSNLIQRPRSLDSSFIFICVKQQKREKNINVNLKWFLIEGEKKKGIVTMILKRHALD